jgi:flagellar assembly protein FliH
VGTTVTLGLDLGSAGLGRLDPSRIEASVVEGHAAGYAAGFAQGEAAARAAADAVRHELERTYERRLAALVHAADAAVADALTGLGAVADAAARVTAGAAFAVAEAIVGRELELATHPGRDAVSRALALAPDDVELTLRLHPDDVAALSADTLVASPHVRVVADPSLHVGDCVADAGWTRVDARIGTALDRVRAVLEGAG